MKSTIFLSLIFALFFLLGCQASSPSLSQLEENDVLALSYAYAVNQFGSQLYTTGLALFNKGDFDSVFKNASAYQYFGVLQQHTTYHLQTINQLLNLEPATNSTVPFGCSFAFPSLNFPTFLLAAYSFEQYASAVHQALTVTLYDKNLIGTFSSIFAVKARHLAFLNRLWGVSPFPSPFEPSWNFTDSLPSQLIPFFSSCLSFPPNAPLILTPVPPVVQGPQPSRQPVLPKRDISLAVDAINPSLALLTANDVDLLNYLLGVNYLQSSLFNKSLSQFSASNFAAVGISAADYASLKTILSEKKTQAQVLIALLDVYDAGNVFKPCTFDFQTVTSVSGFLSTAQFLENLGVSSLADLATKVYNKQLLSLILSILGSEARYAAFLNQLTGQSPFPSALESFLPATTVEASASQFLDTCTSVFPRTKLYLVVPMTSTPTPTPGAPTPGTCLVSDFNFDAGSWSTTNNLNLTSNNSTLVVVSPIHSSFYLLAPSRFRGDLSAFYAQGNGTVSILYADEIQGNSAGLIIRGGNGFELVYPFTNGSFFEAQFGDGNWGIRASNSTANPRPASATEIVSVLTYVTCFLVEGSPVGLQGFNLCDSDPSVGSDCPSRCSNNGRCIPNFPSGPSCSCNYGFSGVDCSQIVRNQVGRFPIPPRVITWNYGI